MTTFNIESLQPIGDDFWKAEVKTVLIEPAEGRSFGQWTTQTIRFKYRNDGDVAGLQQLALDEARRCLLAASAALQGRALAELADTEV